MKLLALSSILFTACVAQPTALDPVGTWNMSQTFTTGSCGATGMSMNTITVTEGDRTTYVIHDSDPTVTSTSGAMECSETSCRMQLHETGTVVSNGMTLGVVLDASLTVDDTDQIIGVGSMVVDNITRGTTCTQAFRASGTRR